MKTIKSITKSIILFIISLTITGLIYTILLYNNILSSKTNITICTYLIGILIFFIAGIISGKNSSKKGWLHGLSTGIIIYSIVIILKSLFHDLNDLSIIIKIITYLFSSTLGGIIGININKKMKV